MLPTLSCASLRAVPALAAALMAGAYAVPAAQFDASVKPTLSTKPGETWTNSLGLRFAFVPAGEFVMGSPPTEKDRSTNEVQHRVKLTRPFFMGVTHVTVGQFRVFASQTGFRTAAEREGWAYGAWNQREQKWDKLEGGSWKNPGFPQTDTHPVVCVNWHEATAFCDWLSAREGLRYRLPTEAEWEYACRAGTQTAYIWGNNPDDGKGWANCSDQTTRDKFTLFPPFTWSDGYVFTSPVASFKPNAWGLYDMLGNALEWCQDWYGDYPAAADTVDPQGVGFGKERILRGGSFIYGPRHCRCAFRGRNLPEFRNFYVGFRVVLERDSLLH